jgi:hypothetical protein
MTSERPFGFPRGSGVRKTPTDEDIGSQTFVSLVEKYFAFVNDYGFELVKTDNTLVVFRKGDLDVNVYLGRKSFEVGITLMYKGEPFAFGEIVQDIDPVFAEASRNPTAFRVEDREPAVRKVAEEFQRYGKCAMLGEPEYFEALLERRKAWSASYALDVREEQTRPKAEAAFREGRYREAAELYESIAPRLTPTEQAKLKFARKRS